ncbi:MAG: VanZ family protein [Planctomycetaceae bacterium]|nr:VanZ family protein [Planctomycetaceae bacterium]
MKLLRRHKAVLIVLAVYWPVIFALTHIPVPNLARQSGMSDKTMHVLAYFVLAFLAWCAWNPYEKVNWLRWKVWALVAAIACYGMIDELLQRIPALGRSADVIDFAANMAGALTALILLSLVSFWGALLTVCAIFIFSISNLSHLLSLYPQFHLNTLFSFAAYGGFTLIAIQWLGQMTSIVQRRSAWLFYSLLLSVLLLCIVLAAAPLFHRSPDWIDAATSLAASFLAAMVSFFLFKLTRPS